MNSRTVAILLALAAGLAPTPSRADGFLGIFGKKDEKAMPGEDELARREGESRGLAARAAAEEANGDFAKAAKLLLESAKEFPLASGAPDAAFRSGELYERAGKPEKAFDAYQEFITRFKADKRFKAALDRQFALGMACKDGQFTGRVLGLPIGVSRTDTIKMLETVATNSPRSRMAGQARIAVAELHAKSGDLAAAVLSYEKVVDEMPGTPEAGEAQFRIGQTYQARAEQKNKDRTTVTTARRSYEDYLLQNPKGAKAGEARSQIQALGSKEAKEIFEIARFYERTNKPQAAAIYYREVLGQDDPDLAAKAKARLDVLGASGVKPPEASAFDDALLFPDESRTKDRDDYAGPPVPDLRPKLPSLRYLDQETLPGAADLPPPGDENPLLEDAPPPPAPDGAGPGPEKPAAKEEQPKTEKKSS